ncbi:MAG TPA: hypothetical protein VE973_01415 [Candidatus Limnocylindria bacterium]|nr:hypothetical protein [Candidatus Limnocylindria bacterium]
MNALYSLKSAVGQSPKIGIIALILLTPVIFPRLAFAAELQTVGQQNQIFEIKVSDSNLLKPNSLSIQEATDKDPLVISLKQYLKNNDSPLGVYAAEIIKLPQWQRALAVSYVESHMGRDCFNNNCSGMGGAPGTPTWRKYATKLDWFIDLTNLLEKPVYKDVHNTFQKMRGFYVQPGSDAWVYGATKKYNELMALTTQADLARQATAQSITALATFPETTN